MKRIPLPFLLILIISCQPSDSFLEKKHLINDYPARIDSVWINMVVEIPSGSSDKWEVNKSSGVLEWEQVGEQPRVINYLSYPANYGFTPQTLLDIAFGGDGDPLDIIALGPAMERGKVIPVRIIGILRMVDRGQQDDKLIGVIKGSVFENLEDIKELDARFPGVTDIIQHWFSNYKGQGLVKCNGFGGYKEANIVLGAAIEGYRRQK